jgi:pyrroloquinoline quinone biosynthesis protein D
MEELLGAKPRLHPETGVQRVGGRLLAAGPPNSLHTFEDEAGVASLVAERIVELSDGSRTVSEIVDALVGEFDVAPEECLRDTQGFIQLLVERQVLVLG